MCKREGGDSMESIPFSCSNLGVKQLSLMSDWGDWQKGHAANIDG